MYMWSILYIRVHLKVQYGSIIIIRDIIALTSSYSFFIVSPTNSITINPNFTTVSNYGYATFNCSAEGGPNNIFVWIRSEDISSLNLVSQSGFSAENTMTALADFSISNASVLSVMVSNPAQNGGGYTCFVYNEAEIGGSYATLHVTPFITQPPQPQYVK